MVWKEGLLFHYLSRKESLQFLEEAESEWDKTHLGIAKKLFYASLSKYPTSMAYFRLKDCLWQLRDERGLKKLEREWKSVFEPQLVRDEIFEEKLKLVGVNPPPSIVSLGEKIKLACFWQSLKPIKKELAVFIHFEGPEGSLFQGDHFPFQKKIATNKMIQKEVIGDFFEVTVPKNIPSGTYKIYTGWWDIFGTKKRLMILDSSGKKVGSRLKIGEIVCEERS